MKQIIGLLAGTLIATLAAGEAQALSASFSWAGITPCGTTSPAFSIRGTPAATRALRFTMSDLDAPSYNHGGGIVAYDGDGNVPRGAVNYIGPCPPTGQVHRYVWVIEALDGKGAVIDRAQVQSKYPVR